MISQIACTIAAALAADPAFASRNIEVITERKGDISNEITKALGKFGLCLLVLTPDATMGPPMRNAIRLRPRFVIQVSEKSAFNKTGLSAIDAVTAIIRRLHQLPNGTDTAGEAHRLGINELVLDPQPYQLVPDESGLILYHVSVVTDIVLTAAA
jgi:hypothetical protein